MKTLAHHLDEYKEYCRGLNRSPLTIRGIHYHGRTAIKFFEEHFNIDTPDRLQVEHLHAYQRHLSKHITAKGLPLSPRSINRKTDALRTFLRHLANRGLVSKLLPKSLQRAREPKDLPKGFLTHEEFTQLMAVLDTSTHLGYRDRTMLELMYSSGLRSCELLSLDTGSVDLEEGVMRVMGKGSKERLAPVGKTALRYLESYLKGVRPFLLDGGEETAIFLSCNANRLGYRSLLNIVGKYAGLAGLENVATHTFRRSCTTELVKSGANLYHVKEFLGHENLNTLSRYTKLNVEDLRGMLERCHPRERG